MQPYPVGPGRTCCGRHRTPGSADGRRQCGSRLARVLCSPLPRPCRHASCQTQTLALDLQIALLDSTPQTASHSQQSSSWDLVLSLS